MSIHRSLIVLVYNEIDGIQVVLPKLPMDEIDEVLVVDGGSTDGTIEWCAENGFKLVGQDKKGRGEAFRVGAEHTSGEFLVYFSPDGNEDPEDIPRLFDALEQGADMAIASRFLPDSVNEEDDALIPARKWANQAFTILANLTWNRGKFVKDTINGFRGVRREVFELLSPQSMGYTVEFEMTIRAFKSRLNIVEIATEEGQRIGGESYAKSLPTGLRFTRFYVAELFRGKPQPRT